MAREFKNQGDGKKADGAILKNENAVAVIELKSTKTKDLKSITEQAFNYKNNQPECKYVITSNFQKLRFYIDYANEFEEFDLFYLQKEEFELLNLILNINSVFSDLPQKLKEETKFHDQEISDKLYKDYSDFKNKLYENLIKNNPGNDKLILFKKSQKLLDRFLFILFAEDSGLLPPNSISRIIDTYNKLEELDAYKPIYDIYKQYFGYLNIGRKGKTNVDDIPAYNGGLFYVDDLLDNLKIDDEILINDLLKLSEYDFNTEVDVNILGHIFEHSLAEIEEITAEIEGTTTDKSKSKRKKDGVFYTPKYITQYIVENTIGTLCSEKREELEIKEIEFDGTYRTKDGSLSSKGKKLYKKLNDYKDWLLSLKIIDPACGSGAFLNQSLNFLIQEHKDIDDIIAELTNSALRLFDTEKSILENNLYGIDINEESVEIAKLSLWLRTAHKDRKLSNLNNNIKCGNSLCDDPEIAGEKAFDWRKGFPDIMQSGGFDILIGNPPYGAVFSKNEIEYYNKRYKHQSYQLDSYLLFVEKS
ncbi:Eco57I restriction-modification methylase domain-containing protein, partial [Candidatus Venteria ishoeyi]|uniref:Eco57I restriction-modification methylase domain-containing protein n=1 Tax=Candidatus Venteria ishoeyi TaxID=1899563 RepID=UPI00255C68FF